MKASLALILGLVAVGPVPAADWYVATNGSDAAAGHIGAPFATVTEAVSHMNAGDTCFLRGGTYHEAVVLVGENDLTFQAYPGETVTMDGTEVIASAWTPHAGSISKTTLSNDVWQLFADGEMMMPARWPNAFLDDGTVWDLGNHWARIDDNANTTTTMVDDPTGHSDLSALPFSVVDAMAVLNVGSFKSYTRKVNTHSAGSDTFTVNAVGNLKSSLQFYFLEGKLEFLDAEGEWHYNPSTQELYVWGDTNAVIRGKVQDYAFHVTNSDDITISGIDFFATTVYFTGCDRATVEKGAFDYPSCTKRMLGVHSTTPLTTTFNGGSGNTFFDNALRYADTHAVYMNNGTGNTIGNCLFEYIDWSAADLPNLMGTVYMRGSGSIFRGNTAHTTGASEFLDVNGAPFVELNRISNIGRVQNDGSVVQLTIGAQPGSETAYNWFSDTDKYGARFDASTAAGSPTGQDGLMHHNVGFDLKSTIMQKGDDHRCINNTSLDSSNNDIIILVDSISENIGTVVRNNAAEKLSSNRSSYVPLSTHTVHSHNWNGYQNGNADLRTLLRDPDNLDFRPIPNSVLVDAGQVEAGLTDGYIGPAPDIGAYEHGASDYWIPGRREAAASTPVPPDGSTTVKASASLMWLEGLDSTSNDVYLGTDSNAVASASSASPEYVGNQSNNLHDPLGLLAQTYYWRIDAVTPSGTVTGPVWRFTVPGATILAPGIENTPAEDVTATSATIGGRITDGGTGSRVWIYWWPDGGATNQVDLGTQAGAFSTPLSGLQSNQVYHYRCHAQNSYGSNQAASVESFTATGAVVWTELTYDDFESGFGNYTDGGANCYLYTDSANAHQGSNAAGIERFGEAGSFFHTNGIDVDTPGYTRIRVEFWFLTVSMDVGAGDNFFVQYFDGTQWVTLRDYLSGTDFTNGVFQFEELVIAESSHTFPTDMKIRFMCDANGGGDDVYIDEVRVSALGGGPAPSPYETWGNGYGLSGTNATFVADPDGDGMENLYEYSVGGIPTNGTDAASLQPTLAVVGDGGTQQVEYVYRRRTDAAVRGLAYGPELSADLMGGSWGTNGYVEVGAGPLETGFEAVTNRISNNGVSRLFIRLGISID